MGVLWGLTSMRLPRGASVGERGGLVGGRGLSTPAQKSELRQRAMAWIRRGGITQYKQRKDRDPAPEQRGPKVVVSGGLKLAALTKAVASIMRRGLLPQDGFSWSVGLITLWQVHAAALADSVGAVLKAPLHHAVHGRRNVDAAQRRCKVDASFVGVEGRQALKVHVSVSVSWPTRRRKERAFRSPLSASPSLRRRQYSNHACSWRRLLGSSHGYSHPKWWE